jgi:excisionase family DNA binding protein
MLTLTEAAALLDLSPITLRLQVRNGKLLAHKRGRDWFVSQREVERYRKENKRLVGTHTHRFAGGDVCSCGYTPPVLTGGSPEGLSSGGER